MSDVNFYFDPVCPFAWMTSKWVRAVADQRRYDVEWRFISLRLINADVDYDERFPADYEDGHTTGLKLLRVAAAVRAEHGPSAIAPLYRTMGAGIFDRPAGQPAAADAAAFARSALATAGLPVRHAEAADDESFDDEVRAETDEALSLTGRDVGTPILHFRPPEGVAFFGPVISRLPAEADAVRLWDHVVGLASFPGFAELKRSLRERPQLASFGVREGEVGTEEDWRGGSRRGR